MLQIVKAISSFTPSSTACPVGAQFLPRKRRGSALRSSTTTYCGMLLWSREHRNSLTMYIPSIDQLPRWGSRVLMVSFPLPVQPLNLCMIYEEKNITISPALWLLSLLEGNVQEMTEGVQFEMVSKYTHFLRIATPYLY